MQTVSLKTHSSDTAIPLLKNAISREKRIIKGSLKITKEKVAALSKSLGVDTAALMKGAVKHTDANDMQLIELEGEIMMVKRLETQFKELEAIEICK